MVKRNMLNVFSNLLCYIFLATYYYFAYSYKIKYLFTIYLMVINCLAHFSYNMVRWGFRSYTTNLKIYLSFWFAHIKSHQILFYLAKQLKWKIKFFHLLAICKKTHNISKFPQNWNLIHGVYIEYISQKLVFLI